MPVETMAFTLAGGKMPIAEARRVSERLGKKKTGDRIGEATNPQVEAHWGVTL